MFVIRQFDIVAFIDLDRYNCDDFENIKTQWMNFLKSQKSVSAEIKAEMENFRALQKDEKYKVHTDPVSTFMTPFVSGGADMLFVMWCS